MRSTAIIFVSALILTTGCRTENCPEGMERLESGLCMDIESQDELDTGALMDTGGQE